MKRNSIDSRSKIFLTAIVLIIIASVIFINIRAKFSVLSYHFNGFVDSVRYNVKGQAYITIKGTQYYLSDPDWDFDHNRIQRGDSMIKKKNSMVIKLFKRNHQIVIEGKDN